MPNRKKKSGVLQVHIDPKYQIEIIHLKKQNNITQAFASRWCVNIDKTQVSVFCFSGVFFFFRYTNTGIVAHFLTLKKKKIKKNPLLQNCWIVIENEIWQRYRVMKSPELLTTYSTTTTDAKQLNSWGFFAMHSSSTAVQISGDGLLQEVAAFYPGRCCYTTEEEGARKWEPFHQIWHLYLFDELILGTLSSPHRSTHTSCCRLFINCSLFILF